MKATKCFVMFLFFSVLPAISQTAPQRLEASSSIAVARCQYASFDTACTQASSTDGVLAQYPQGRGFHPPMGPPRGPGYPGGYPSMYAGEGSPRHVLIGALIGFGLGAAVGAKANTDQHPGADVKAAFLVGGVGALIGAAVGSQIPASPFPHHYRRRHSSWPEDDEDATNRGGRKAVHLAAASTPASAEKTP